MSFSFKITWNDCWQTDHASSTQRQENKITITLIAVVILFMICQIPTAILFILKNAYKSSDPYLEKFYRILGNIFNFLVTLNAAANFLLYCAFSARYRRTLIATFFGKCIRLSSPTHSTVTTPESNHLKRGQFFFSFGKFYVGIAKIPDLPIPIVSKIKITNTGNTGIIEKIILEVEHKLS